MVQYAEPIERLIQAFSRLPGIGEKSATRLALFILNSKSGYVEELVESLDTLKEKVKLCGTCMAFSATDPCPTCSDPSRNHAVICVVSDFKDMMALDGAGGFSGSYHILHGNLAPLKGVGPDELRIKELTDRVSTGGVEEVILATGFDSEGEATALYLARVLKPHGVKLTRLASGVPVGSYVEYMDGVTLGRAMDGRRLV
ncbi:MAG: recombination protein RecR [Proteobacteria bacterium]|nr:recombination protein RecR [Pseudomonadota bacterium]